MDIELVRAVSEDLDYLFNEWNQDIDDASLRRNSTVLRFLLVYENLQKVANYVGREIRIMTPALCKFIKEEHLKNIDLYQAGGATYNGAQVMVSIVTYHLPSKEERDKIASWMHEDFEKICPVKISAYLTQISFGIEGTAINRAELIKYVANKLGAAHYDNSRDESGKDAALVRKYLLLDKVRKGQIKITDKNILYFELLSIGQRVVNSQDVRNLRKYLGHLLQLPPVIYL
jgi:hypothetical protein